MGRLQTHPRTRSSPPQPGWRRRRRRWLPTRCYRAPVRASRRKPPAHAPHARAGAASGRRRGRPRPNRARGYLHPRGCRCARAAPAEGRGAPSPSRLGSRGCDRRRLGGRGRRPSGERHSERGAGVHGAGAEAGGGPRGTPFMEATAAAAGERQGKEDGAVGAGVKTEEERVLQVRCAAGFVPVTVVSRTPGMPVQIGLFGRLSRSLFFFCVEAYYCTGIPAVCQC